MDKWYAAVNEFNAEVASGMRVPAVVLEQSRVLDIDRDEPIRDAKKFREVTDVSSRGVTPLGNAADGKNEETRPRCKKCRKFMKYNPAEDQMECTTDGCGVVAKKARTFINAMGAALTGRPVFYRGKVQFVATDDGELGLYLEDINAVVSLDQIAGAKPFEADPVQAKRMLSFLGTVADHLPSAQGVVERAARRKKREEDLEQIDARAKRRREAMTQRLRSNFTDTVAQKQVFIPPHLVTRQAQIQEKTQELLVAMSPNNVTPELLYEMGCKAIACVEQEVNGDLVSGTARVYDGRGNLLDSVDDKSKGLSVGYNDMALYKILMRRDGAYIVYRGVMHTRATLDRRLRDAGFSPDKIGY